MRLLRFLVLLFLPFNIFCQTSNFIDELKATDNDSLKRIEVISELLLKSVSCEYPDSIAWQKYNEIGMVFYSKNIPEYAGKFFLCAYDKALSAGNDDKAAQMLSNMGVVNEMSGDYIAALENYQKSLKAFIKTGNKKSQSLVYNNIAIIHQELDNDNLAYYNLKKSFDLKVEVGDSLLIASAYNNLGVYFEEQKNDPDSALICYFSAKQIYVKKGDDRNVAICDNNIANILFQVGDYDNARRVFNQTINKFRETDDKLWLSRALMYLGQLEMKTYNFLQAVDLLAESVEILKHSGYTRYYMEASKGLADAYIEVGDYKNSALTYKQFFIIQDSILNSDKQKEVRNLELKYQTVQKDLVISKLNEERIIRQKFSQRVFYFILFIVILLSSFVIILLMKVRHKKLILQNKNMLIKQEILQNQMNPHFLFNVLTSIQSYMNEKDSEKASSYLSKFSRLIRMVLQSSANDKILLSEEIELLTNYIQLEQLRLGNSFEYNLIVDENLDAEEINIPPMMIQPFVENAIKHGLKGIENGILELKIVDKGEYIVLSVRDNGKGFDKESVKNKNHKSMAIGIINERVEILKHKFRKNVSVNYEIVEKGTKIVVELPVI